jgi:AraC-like DNA-binding protein
MSIRTGGRDFELKPGTAIAGSGELQGVLDIRSDARFLCLSLSRSQIAGLVPNISSLGGILIPPGSQPLRLLLGYVRMLDAEETIASPEARRLLSAHVHDLAALAIGASGDATVLAEGRGVRAARLAAIKAYILDNLARPDLSVAIVAAQQEVTPRYVHMLFETDGVTFSEYVTTQRLTRAQRILRDSRFAHQTIAAIALSVGFGDLSYFNRTFRRRFGMTPSDAREQARRGGGR